MKNRTRIAYYNVGNILIQAIALVMLFLDRRIAAAFIIANVIVMILYTAWLLKKGSGKRICGSCASEMAGTGQICVSCGHIMEDPYNEEEMMEIMRGKDNKIASVCMDELDREFEKVEQMSAEQALSLDRDDVESILMQKIEHDAKEV